MQISYTLDNFRQDIDSQGDAKMDNLDLATRQLLCGATVYGFDAAVIVAAQQRQGVHVFYLM